MARGKDVNKKQSKVKIIKRIQQNKLVKRRFCKNQLNGFKSQLRLVYKDKKLLRGKRHDKIRKIEFCIEEIKNIDDDIISAIKARSSFICALNKLLPGGYHVDHEAILRRAKEAFQTPEMAEAIWPIIFKYTEPDI